MKILLLEDRASVATNLVQLLQKRGHTVLDCVAVNDARSAWEDNTALIGCIILDLNIVPPPCFTKEQLEDTKGGVLTGWVWLRDFVYNEHPEMKARTVIFSDYTEILPRDHGVATIVPKRGQDSPIDRLLREVERIGKLPPRE